MRAMSENKTEIWLEVYGDWWTVISANDYREMLLAQKPHDADDADYYAYRIRCKDSKELFQAIKVFHEEKKLECHVAIHKFDDAKRITAMTGAGWVNGGPSIYEDYKHDNPKELIEQRDELRSALCVARENGRNQLGLTLRKFAALCGRSPSWISRWTNSDIDGPPDLVDYPSPPPNF